MVAEANGNTPKLPHFHFFLIIYITMFIFGLIETQKSLVFPAIKLQYGISYTETGRLISFTWFGYVLLCFLVTLFLQRFGLKRSFVSSYIIIVSGCLLTLLASTYLEVMLAIFLINTSFGFFEVGTNALAMKIFKTKTALLMSLLHFFYGLGAVLGPYIGAFILKTPAVMAYFPSGWRFIYLYLSIPLIFVGIYVCLIKFNDVKLVAQAPTVTETSTPTSTDNIDQLSTHLTFSKVLKIPVVWIFMVMLGFMEVVEFGAANWSPFYLKDVFGLSPEQEGAVFVSLFYMIFTFSRLFGGFVSEKIGYYNALLLCVCMTIVFYILGFLIFANQFWLLVVTGLFVAQFWILTLSLAEKKFNKEAAVITSVIITISGLINGIFQIVIGLTNEYIGNEWGYRSCLLYTIVILIIVLVYKKAILVPYDFAKTK